jgi:elongation factor G
MNKRRGRVLGTEAKDDRQLVTAEAPMAEMVRYATDLRSMTQGRGAYTQEYVRYEEVPSMLIAGIVAASPFKKANVEE